MMENIDPKVAARVWQRVQEGVPEPERPQAPTELLHASMWDAAAFATLARKLRSATAAALAQEERRQSVRLRGLCAYMDGKSPKLPDPSPGTDSPSILLRKCYVNHLRRLAEYERRFGDRDFGPVYRELAAQEQAHCAMLLELLGSV